MFSVSPFSLSLSLFSSIPSLCLCLRYALHLHCAVFNFLLPPLIVVTTSCFQEKLSVFAYRTYPLSARILLCIMSGSLRGVYRPSFAVSPSPCVATYACAPVVPGGSLLGTPMVFVCMGWGGGEPWPLHMLLTVVALFFFGTDDIWPGETVFRVLCVLFP